VAGSDMLSVIMLMVTTLNCCYGDCHLLSVFKLSVIIMSAIMFIVVMASVTMLRILCLA
jgi:hypothetical protein